jgi:hypothetical protein
MNIQKEINILSKQLRDMDSIISKFLEENEKKFGGIDDEDADYTTPVWVEYKRMINERRDISIKLQKLTGKGYI